jgi:hypothetical protein
MGIYGKGPRLAKMTTETRPNIINQQRAVKNKTTTNQRVFLSLTHTHSLSCSLSLSIRGGRRLKKVSETEIQRPYVSIGLNLTFSTNSKSARQPPPNGEKKSRVTGGCKGGECMSCQAYALRLDKLQGSVLPEPAGRPFFSVAPLITSTKYSVV